MTLRCNIIKHGERLFLDTPAPYCNIGKENLLELRSRIKKKSFLIRTITLHNNNA